MPTIAVIYDPTDRVQFKPPPGTEFRGLCHATMRVETMDKLDIALVTQDLIKTLTDQIKD